MTGGMPPLAGGTTTQTVTDNNNPYTNKLAANAQASYGFTMPFLQAQIAGQKTPYSDVNDLTSMRVAKHFAGRYGQAVDDPNLQRSYDVGSENMTKPNMDALQQMMQMYGVGSPSAGGVATTETSKKNLGLTDYAQLAATVAALAKI
jgi:hypothetical protein